MDDNGEDRFTRRDALKAAAAAGLAGVAGCGSGPDGGTDTTTTTDDGSGGTTTETTEEGDSDGTTTETTTTERQLSDRTFRYTWDSDATLPDTELNRYSPSQLHELSWVLHFEMGQYNLPTKEWVHLDAESWEIDTDENEQRITIKDGVHWHRGGEIIDDVTGEDWMIQEHIQRLLIQTAGEASTEPTVVGWDHDGKTFIRKLNPNGYNPRVLENGLQRSDISVYRGTWRDLYERFIDASTGDKASEVQTSILERSITLADDPALSGPYMLQNVSTQRAVFERNPEHWTMEHSSWTNWEMVQVSPTGGADYQAAVSDRIEFPMSIPNSVDALPEPLTAVYSAAGRGFCEVLAPNYGGKMDPWFGFEEPNPEEDVVGKRQAKARQGLAYAISSADIHANDHSSFVANTLTPIEKPMPTHPATARAQLPDIWAAVPSMTDQVYQEEAEAAFRASGLSKQNGQWVKPNGEAVSIQLQSHSWSRDMVATITEDLNDIGLNAEHVVTESSVLFSQQGEGTSGASQAWLDWAAEPIDQTAQGFVVPGAGWPPLNQPFQWKVPPIGEYDAEPSQTWDVREIAAPVQRASNHDEAAVQESIRKLSWIFAYHLPIIPCKKLPQVVAYNGAHFEFPDHPERPANGRVVVPGDGSEAAPVWGVTFNGSRIIRKNPAPPNHVVARE